MHFECSLGLLCNAVLCHEHPLAACPQRHCPEKIIGTTNFQAILALIMLFLINYYWRNLLAIGEFSGLYLMNIVIILLFSIGVGPI